VLWLGFRPGAVCPRGVLSYTLENYIKNEGVCPTFIVDSKLQLSFFNVF